MTTMRGSIATAFVGPSMTHRKPENLIKLKPVTDGTKLGTKSTRKIQPTKLRRRRLTPPPKKNPNHDRY